MNRSRLRKLPPRVASLMCSTALLSGGMASVSVPAFAQAVNLGQQNGNLIIPDGRTATTLSGSGRTTSISTSTLSGGNAFNSFSKFKAGAGNTVNLQVPSSARTLVNIVRDGPVDIQGTLNSFKNGKIGGNVVFSDSFGFVVGKSGVVNTGSLSVVTPTRDVNEAVIGRNGVVNDAAAARLIRGDVPLSPDGSVAIAGRINAEHGVMITAHDVDVAGSVDGARKEAARRAQFESTVNTSGLAEGGEIVVRNGSIRIVAAGNAHVGGRLSAGGHEGHAGSVSVKAGQDLTVDASAEVSARTSNASRRRAARALVDTAAAAQGPAVSLAAGNKLSLAGKVSAKAAANGTAGRIEVTSGGDTAIASTAVVQSTGLGGTDGGHIRVYADGNLLVANSATFSAAAKGTGNGGHVELSATHTAAIGTINLDLSAVSGQAGSLLLDPYDLVIGTQSPVTGASSDYTVSSSILSHGASITLAADHSITVQSGGSIDSRNLDPVTQRSLTSSGAISISAPLITVLGGGQVRADVNNGTGPGATNYAAGDISLLATADAASQGVAAITLGDTGGTRATIAGHNLLLQATSTVPDGPDHATILVQNADMTGNGTAQLLASATGTAAVNSIGALADVDVLASVDVIGSAHLVSTGAMTLGSTASATVTATGASPFTGSLPGDASAAVATISSIATTHIGGTATVSTTGAGSAMSLSARNTVSSTVTADASASGASAASGSVAVNVVQATTTASVDGDAAVNSAGDLQLSARSLVAATTAAKAAAQGGSSDTPSGVTAEYLGATSGPGAKYAEDEMTTDGAVAATGALSISDLTSTTSATMSASHAATATGALGLSSITQNSASSTADGSAGGSQTGIGVGLAIGLAHVSNTATIAQSVTAASVGVSATMDGAAAGNAFATSASSGAGASNVGVAGSLATNLLDSESAASIASGTVTITGAGAVLVASDNETSSSVAALPSGAGASGGKVGVGASVALNLVATRSNATIASGVVLTGAGDLTLQADADHAVTTQADQGSSGGVAVTPVVALSLVDDQTQAVLGTPGVAGSVSVSGTVLVSATQRATEATEANGSAAGGKAAVGAALALALVNDDVEATTTWSIASTGGTGVSFRASGASLSVVSATASASGGNGSADGTEGEAGSAAPSSKEDSTVDGKVQKLSSSASDKETNAGVGSTEQQGEGKGAATKENGSASTSEGSVAVAAAIAVDVSTSTVKAFVPASVDITTPGALEIAAVNNTDALVSADGSQVGSDAAAPKIGIGAAVAVSVVHVVNDATLGTSGGAGTYSAGSVSVTALKTDLGATTPAVPGSTVVPTPVVDTALGRPDQIGAEGTSGAGATNVGVAGSLGVVLLDSESVATIASGTLTITGGAVEIASDNETASSVAALPSAAGAAGGKVGVGASVALNTVTMRSQASLADGVALSGAGSLAIKADALTNTETTATGGAKGGIAIDAVVALSILSETTSATLGSGSATTFSGDVSVTATSEGENLAAATGAVDAANKTGQTQNASAGGTSASNGAGVGASAAIITGTGIIGAVTNSNAAITSSTTASVARDLTVGGALTVTAESTRTYDAEATAIAGGALFNDSDPSEGGKSTSVDTLNTKQAQGAMDKVKNTLGSSGGGSKLSVAAALGAALVGDQVKAEIVGSATDKRTLTVDGAVTVEATSTGNLIVVGDGVTVSKTSVGIGIGAALAVLDNQTGATIADGTHLIVGGDVSVTATSTQNRDPAYATRLTAQAMSGSSGQKIAVAGSLAVAISTSATTATLGDGVTIDATTDPHPIAGAVDVAATSTAPLSAKAWGGAYSSSGTGVGASIAAVIAEDTTSASIGNDATVNAASLAVTATDVKIDVPQSVFNLLVSDVQAGSYDDARGTLKTVGTDAMNNALLGENNYYTEVLAGAASGGQNAIAGGFGIQVIGNTVLAKIGTGASIGTTGAIAISADDQTVSKALDGSLAVSLGSTSVGVSSTIVTDTSTVTALLDAGATITASGSLAVTATSAQSVDVFEASAAVADQISLSGILGVITLDVATASTLGAGSHVTSSGAVAIGATDAVSVINLAGAISGSGQTAIGATAVATTVLNTVEAQVNSDAANRTVLDAGSILVTAALTDRVIDLAVAGGVAGEAAVVGAATPVTQNATVLASIGQDATLTAATSIGVTASDDATVYNIGGAAAVAGTTGIGGSAAVSTFADTTRAFIDTGATIDAATSVTIGAEASESVVAVVVAGAAAGNVSVTVALASAIVTDTTEAYLAEGATVGGTTRPAGLYILASDTTRLTDVAGSAALGGSAGVGAGADVDVLIKHTHAWLGQSSTSAPSVASTVHASGDVVVDAESLQSVNSVVVGFAAGGDAGVAGSASIYSLTGDTLAGIANGDTVSADGNVAVLANDQNSLLRVVGSAAGGGTAGIGASLGVSVAVQTTTASIGDNTTIVALGNTAAQNVILGFDGTFTSYVGPAAAPVSKFTSALGAERDPTTVADAVLEGGSLFLFDRTATPDPDNLRHGVIVNATNRDAIRAIAASGGIGGTVDVTLSGDLPVVVTDTEASIGTSASINAAGAGNSQQSVTVAAASDIYHVGIAGSAGGAGTVGVGGGAEVNVVINTTKASIADGSTVDAANDVAVTARASEDFAGTAATAQAAGEVAVAGGVTGFSVVDTTSATIGAADHVRAGGNVLVVADDQSRAVVAAGTLSIGGATAGVGGGVGISIFVKNTTASVGAGAHVTALGQGSDFDAYTGAGFSSQGATRGLLVLANSGQSVDTVVGAGAGGFFAGVAGVVSVEVVLATTQASIDDGAQINVDQNTNANAAQGVNVTARDSTVLATADGSLGIGAAGVAGALDLAVISNTVAASIADSAVVNAAGDVRVNGLENQATSATVASVGGGIGGVAAAFSILAITNGLDPDQTSDLQTSNNKGSVDGYASSQLSDGSMNSLLSTSSNQNVAAASASAQSYKGQLSVTGELASSTQIAPGVSATIGNVQINAGGVVGVHASDDISTDFQGGALAAEIGVGAGIGVAAVKVNTTAEVASGANITAGSAEVEATANRNYTSIGVAATAAGIAAAAVTVGDGSTTTAEVGHATIRAGGAITISATNDTTAHLATTSLAAGTAGGLVVLVLTPDTNASIGANATVEGGRTQAGDVSVTASSSQTLITGAAAAVVGGVGAGITVAVITPDTEAAIGAGATVQAGDLAAGATVGSVIVAASNDQTLDSAGAGLAVAGEAGGALTVFTLAGSIEASIAAARVTATGDVGVFANSTAAGNILVGGAAVGGGVGVGGSIGVSVIDTTTSASIADNAEVLAYGMGAGQSYVAGYEGTFSSYVAGLPTPASFSENVGAATAGAADPTTTGDVATAGADLLTQQRNATLLPTSATKVHGVIVNAANADAIRAVSVSAAISGLVSAAISANVPVVISTTSATVGQAKINQNGTLAAAAGQSVTVAAANDVYDLGVVGSVAGGGAAGVGAGFSAASVTAATTASIAANATVSAKDDVVVSAHGSEDFSTMAASAGLGGAFAINGGLSLIVLNDHTLASIGTNAKVTAGNNVAVLADDITRGATVAGAAAVGGLGAFGGAVGASILTKDTEATIYGGAQVTGLAQGSDTVAAYGPADFTSRPAMQGVLVQANSDESLLTVGIAGAFGDFAGVAGAISVNVLNITVQADIDAAARINTTNAGATNAQKVAVVARDSAGIVSIDGSLGVGSVGFGGSVDVGVLNTSVGANIGNGVVINSVGDLTVAALANKAIGSTVVSGSAGLAAIAAGISVYTIGDGIDPSSKGGSELQPSGQPSIATYAGTQLSSGGTVSGSVSATTTNGDARAAGTKVSSTFGTVDLAAMVQNGGVAGTAATVGSATLTSTSGQVAVETQDKVDANQITGALAVGGIGVGAGIGVITDTASNTVSLTGTKLPATSADGVSAVANTDHAMTITSLAGAASVLVSVEADVAVASDTSTTTTTLSGVTATGAGLLDIEANTSRQIAAHAEGGAIAIGGAVGISYATADAEGSVGTTVTNLNANLGSARIKATSNDAASADALALAAGIGLAGEGAVAKATAALPVTLTLDHAVLHASGAVTLWGTATEAANATSTGYALSLGVAGGESEADAISAPLLAVNITDGSDLAASSLDIEARVAQGITSPLVSASAQGSTGGFLVINATQASASNGSHALATVSGSTLTTSGAMTIAALNTTSQSANAQMLAVGAFARGDNIASASSDTLTEATLTDLVALSAGSLSLNANNDDFNAATSTAGTGGVVAGAAANASTSSRSTTLATTTTSAGASPYVIAALGGTASITATHTATFTGSVDSTQAALAGLSGSTLTHTVDSTVDAHLGDRTSLLAGNLTIDARNLVHKYFNYSGQSGEPAGSNPDDANWDVNSGSGGLFNAAAGSVVANIAERTNASIGANASVHLLAPTAGFSTLDVEAYNETVVHEKAKVDAGGAVEIAEADAIVNVNQSLATVAFGDHSAIVVDIGDIVAGAWANASLDTRVATTTYGLAGAPSGKAYANYTGQNTVTVGLDTQLQATNGIDPTDPTGTPTHGTIQLAAGDSPTGVHSNLALNATVDLYNNTAIPIPTAPDAQANLVDNSTLTIMADPDQVIGNANPSLDTHYGVNAAGDITLSADKGDMSTTAVGTGKNIYLEALSEVGSAISNLFGGGDITFDVKGGSTSRSGTGTLVLDGLVDTGLQAHKAVTIAYNANAQSGADVSGSGNIAIGTPVQQAVNQTIITRLAQLEALKAQYASDPIAVAAYNSEISFLQSKLVALGLGSYDANHNFVPSAYATTTTPKQAATATLTADQALASSSQALFAAQTLVVTEGQTNPAGTNAAAAASVANYGVLDAAASALTSIQGLSNYSTAIKADPAKAALADITTQRTAINNALTLLNAALANNTSLQSDINTKTALINTLQADITAKLLANDTAGVTQDRNQIQTAQSAIAADLGTIASNNSAIYTQTTAILANTKTLNTDLGTIATASKKTADDQTKLDGLNAANATDPTKTGALQRISRDIDSLTTQQATIQTGNGVSATQIATLTGTSTTGGTVTGVDASGNLVNSLGQWVTVLGDQTTRIAADTTAVANASDQPASAPSTFAIDVDPVYARIANIYLNADRVTSTGTSVATATGLLSAPGDATITIINNTADTLNIGNLTVPDVDAGHIRFNGVLVNSVADINALNGAGAPLALKSVTTASTGGAPTITIQNNYDDGSLLYFNPAAASPDVLKNQQVAPDIVLKAGSAINNLNGAVSITSAEGNIYLQGPINAGSIAVVAKNGDLVSSYVNGFNNVGGDPGSQNPALVNGVTNQANLGLGMLANGSIIISARYLNINSTIQSGIADNVLTLATGQLLTTTNPTTIGVTQAQIDALVYQYQTALDHGMTPATVQALALNPNVSVNLAGSDIPASVIQGFVTAYRAAVAADAGASPLYRWTDPATGEVEVFNAKNYNVAPAYLEFSVATANAYAAANNLQTANYSVITPDTDTIGATYDAVKKDYFVNNTAVHGGSVQLFGQIMNTSTNSGAINVLDGFGTITVTNTTGLELTLGSLNTGQDPTGTLRGTQGTIDITDVNVGAGNVVNATHTIYTRDYTSADPSHLYLLVEKQTGTINSYGVASYGAFTVTETLGGRTSTYTPATANERYVFTTGANYEAVTNFEHSGTNIFHSSALSVNDVTSLTKTGQTRTSQGRLADGTYVTTDITQNATGSATLPNSDNFQNGIVIANSPGTSTNYDLRNTPSVVSTVAYITSSNLPPPEVHTSCNWYSLCIAEDETDKYTLTQDYTVITTTSLKADNTIAINFIGQDAGAVTVTSNANVVLSNAITNVAGTTSITATGGTSSIIQDNPGAIISSKSIDLEAAGSIGGVANPLPASNASAAVPIAVTLTHDQTTLVPAGSLTANAGNGVVSISSSGTLAIGTVTAKGDATQHLGSVTLDAGNAIVAASNASLIQADSVTLTAHNGAIGSTANGQQLTVDTGYTANQTYRPFGDPTTASSVGDVNYNPNFSLNPYYGLTATAAGDIGIAAKVWGDNAAGTILANQVISTGGNVLLSTPGQILDNNPAQTVDSRTYAQLLNYWNTLQLTGTAAAAKAADTVATYDRTGQQDYNEYWQIRATQPGGSATYDPNFQVTIAPGTAQYNTLAAYYAAQNPGQPVDAQIQAYAASETARYHALNAEVGSLTTAYNPAFVFQADATATAKLESGAVWTTRELAFSLAAGALKTVTNTNPVVKAPNVSGRTVTLDAAQGLGETVVSAASQPAPGIVIPAGIDPSLLTDADKVALASAERSDLTLTINGLAPGIVRSSLTGAAAAAYDAAVNLGSVTIPLGADIASLTAPQQAALLAAANGLADPAHAFLTVLDKRPLNFAAATALNVSVTGPQSNANPDLGNAYVASRGDAKLGSVAVTGETRIKVDGSITNAAGGSTVSTGNLILEAAQGFIGSVPLPSGTASTALVIDPHAGATITARAQQGIDIRSTNAANVDTLYSPQGITLEAATGITNANNDALINILGSIVRLTADNGSIGAVPNRLNVGTNIGGGIYATALNGSVNLYGPDPDDFIIKAITAGQSVDLAASLDGVIDGTVQAGGAIRLGANGRFGLTANADVIAQIGVISVDAATFKILNGGQLDALLGDVSIVTTGNAVVTGITSGSHDPFAVSITSGGHVFAGTDPTRTADITALATGAGVYIRAALGIGDKTEADDELSDSPTEAPGTADLITAVPNPLIIATGSVNLASSGGPVDVITTAPVSAGVIEADTGSIDIHALGDFRATSVTALLGNITILGDGSLDIGSASAVKGTIDLSAATTLTVGTTISGGTQKLSGVTGVFFTSLTTTGLPGDLGDIDLTSTQGPVNGQPAGHSLIDAHGNVDVHGVTASLDMVRSGGATAVTTTGALTLAALTTGTSGQLTAGGAITLATATDGTTLGVNSTGSTATIGSATTGGTQMVFGDTGVFFTSLTTTGIPGDAGDIDLDSTNGPVNGQPAGQSMIDANGNVTVHGTSVALDVVTSGGFTSVAADGALTLATLSTGTSGQLLAGGAISLGTATDGTTLGLTSTGSTAMIGTAKTGGTQMVFGEAGVFFTSLTTTGIPGDAGDIDLDSTSGPVNGQPAGQSVIDANGNVHVNGVTVALDTVNSGGSATVAADGALTLATLATGTAGELTAGGAVTLGSAVDGTTLGLTSTGSTVTIGTALTGGTQRLSGQTGVVFTSLTTTGVPGDDGDVDVTSVAGPVTGTTIDAHGNAVVHGVVVGLDSVKSGLATTLSADGSLTLTTLTTGTSGQVTAGGAIAVGTAQDGTSLGLTSTGSTVTIGTAVSGGTQMLSGHQGVFFTSLTTTGIPGDDGDVALTSDAGPVDGQPVGTSIIDAHGDVNIHGVNVRLDKVVSGGATTATADDALSVATLATGTSGQLTAGGTITLGTAQDGTSLGLTSTGSTVTIGTALTGGTQMLTGHQGVFFTSLTTTGVPGDNGDVDLTSDAGPVDGQPVGGSIIDAHGNVNIHGVNVRLDKVVSGGATTATADDALSVATLTTGTSGRLTAGGAVTLGTAIDGTTLDVTSTGSTVTIGTATTGGSQTLTGHEGVFFTALTATGIPGDDGNVRLTSDAGPVVGDTVDANGRLDVNAQRIDFAEIRALAGIGLTSAGTITGDNFFTLGPVDMDAGGAITLGTLTASDLTLTTPSSLHLSNLTVRSSVILAAGDISIGYLQQAADYTGPLSVTLTGYKGAIGNTAVIGDIHAPDGLVMPHLYENTASIQTDASRVTIPDANITGTFTLRTPYEYTLVNNISSMPVLGYNAQLFALGDKFFFNQDQHTITTSSYVVQYDETPLIRDDLFNQIYVGASFVRDFTRFEQDGNIFLFFTDGLDDPLSSQFPASVFDRRLERMKRPAVVGPRKGRPAVNIDAGTTSGPRPRISGTQIIIGQNP